MMASTGFAQKNGRGRSFHEAMTASMWPRTAALLGKSFIDSACFPKMPKKPSTWFGHEARYRRIHENCAVMRLSKGDGHVLITGDADLKAFRDNITKYHRERLKANVLDASHHGSRSFFMEEEGNDPYLDALEAIDPEYVVVSAPTVKDSPFDHPHADAMKLYKDHVGNNNVHHTGAERECFIVDIDEHGTCSAPRGDNGALTAAYGLDKKRDGGGSGGGKKTDSGPFGRPPASSNQKPREYA